MRRASDAHAGHRLDLHDVSGEREHLVLVLGADEERRAVAARGREVRHLPALELLGDLVAQPLAREPVARDGQEGSVVAVRLEAESRHAPGRLAVVEPLVLQVFQEIAREA